MMARLSKKIKWTQLLPAPSNEFLVELKTAPLATAGEGLRRRSCRGARARCFRPQEQPRNIRVIRRR